MEAEEGEQSPRTYRSTRTRMHVAARMEVGDILQNNTPLGEAWDSPLKGSRRRNTGTLAPLRERTKRTSETRDSSETTSRVGWTPSTSASASPTGSPRRVVRKEDVIVEISESPSPSPPTQASSPPTPLSTRSRLEDLQYIKQLTLQSQLFMADIDRQNQTIISLEKENEAFAEYKTEKVELVARIKHMEKALTERDGSVDSLSRQLRLSKEELIRCHDEIEDLKESIEVYKVREVEAERKAAASLTNAPSVDPMMCLSIDDEEDSAALEAPTGTVSLVFTDITGSTRIWEELPHAMHAALNIHNVLVRSMLADYNGYEVKTLGDAFMLAFPLATDAVAFALSFQLKLLTLEWPPELEDLPDCPTSHFGHNIVPCGGSRIEAVDPMFLWRGLKVRIGINKGEPLCKIDQCTSRMDYLGPVVNKTSRVESQALGGMIAVTREVLDDMEGDMEGLGHPTVSDGNVVKLKGIAEEVEIFQVVPKVLEERLAEAAPMRASPQNSGAVIVSSDDEDDELGGGMPSGTVYVCVARLPKLVELKLKISDAEWDELIDVWVATVELTSYQCKPPYEWWGDKKHDNECEQGIVAFRTVRDATEWALKLQEKMHNAAWPPFCKKYEILEPKMWAGKTIMNGICPRIAIHKFDDVVTEYDPFRRLPVYPHSVISTPSVLSAASRPGQTLVTSEVQQDIFEGGMCTPSVVSYMGVFESSKLPGQGSVVVYQMYPESLAERIYPITGFRDHPKTRRSEKFINFSRSVKEDGVGLDQEAEREVLDVIVAGLQGKSGGKVSEEIESMRMALEDTGGVPLAVSLHRQQSLQCGFTDLKMVISQVMKKCWEEKQELMARPHPDAVAMAKHLVSAHASVREFSTLLQGILDDTLGKDDEKALVWLKPKPGVYMTLPNEEREPLELLDSILGYLRMLVGHTKQWKKFRRGSASPRRGSLAESPRRASGAGHLRGVFARLTQDTERRYVSQSPEKPRERKSSVPSVRSDSPPKDTSPILGGKRGVTRVRGRVGSRQISDDADPIGALEGNSSPLHKPARAPSIMRSPKEAFNL